jgi:hypothetical protein
MDAMHSGAASSAGTGAGGGTVDRVSRHCATPATGRQALIPAQAELGITIFPFEANQASAKWDRASFPTIESSPRLSGSCWW